MQTSSRTRRVYSVYQVNEYAKSILQGDPLLRDISVRGEVSNLKRHSSGHVYFSIKDSEALLRCAFFRQDAMRSNVALKDGLEIVARGYITIYGRDGSYQMVVNSVSASGSGALFELFEKLKNKLAMEGLFDPAHKKPIPGFVKRIAVVTSPTGAVIRDIERVAKARYRGIELILLPVSVQGEGAANEIAKAIKKAGKMDVDVVIAGRGGGSMEDLWAFNEEVVARAIYECEKPVISAVGHETDFTIADFVADRRASTPSNAAEICVADVNSLLMQIGEMKYRSERALKYSIDTRRERIARLLDRPVMSDPRAFLRVLREKLGQIQGRNEAAFKLNCDKKRQSLLVLLEKAKALSPSGVLDRGYAIITKNGAQAGDAFKLNAGDEIEITLKNGQKNAVIKE
ncbi:MAG: exodeoxyribonuclease VII large subunit [Clostridia bacterium]|nr:exodeoxyribonuclease VII large subunit [Clostridia bacterium]